MDKAIKQGIKVNSRTIFRTSFAIIGLIILTSICNAQVENIEICKVDSSSQRVFVYTTRQELQDFNYAKKIIREIENSFDEFSNLKISFFDDLENCGYKVETTGDSADNFEMKINDVKLHWIAEYSSHDRIFKLYQRKNAPLIQKEIKIESKTSTNKK